MTIAFIGSDVNSGNSYMLAGPHNNGTNSWSKIDDDFFEYFAEKGVAIVQSEFKGCKLDDHAAEDIVQESFVSFLSKFEESKFADLRHMKNSFRLILKNKTRQYLRKSKRTKNLLINMIAQIERAISNSESPLERLTARDLEEFIEKMIKSSLTAKDGETIRRSMAGQSIKQIAIQSSSSEQAVRQSLWRGRKMLKSKIESTDLPGKIYG